MSDYPPFWSDDFDMDLLKVLPETPAILGELGDVLLYTHGHETHGRLNHPSVWNGDLGMLAFFGTAREGFTPGGYVTDAPVVECTALEAFRDAWPHQYLIIVNGPHNGGHVWTPNVRLFTRLMSHRRSLQPLPEIETLRGHLRMAVTAAACRLGEILAVARAQET
jgi:hypothetical protein